MFNKKLNRSFYSACPLCCEETEEKEEQERALVKLRRIAQLEKESGIPVRYSMSSLENYSPVNDTAKNSKHFIEKYIKNYETLLKRGTSIVFCGKPGTGKTHLACAVGRALIREAVAVKYISIYNLLLSIKETYNRKHSDAKTERELIRQYISYELLILDEVGVQFGSDYEKIIFFQILNGRYEEMKPTILITNLNQNGLANCIGERCVDRIRENGGAIIPFTWDSFRGMKRSCA
ncbi:MAG: ATP-binding protein [bacterium]|nr:ATP-binding protein [bacterium]